MCDEIWKPYQVFVDSFPMIKTPLDSIVYTFLKNGDCSIGQLRNDTMQSIPLRWEMRFVKNKPSLVQILVFDPQNNLYQTLKVLYIDKCNFIFTYPLKEKNKDKYADFEFRTKPIGMF